MAHPGFLGRVFAAGAKAMRANAPLLLLCALALTISQHLIMQIQGDLFMEIAAAGSSELAEPGFESLPSVKSFPARFLQGSASFCLYVIVLFGVHAAILRDGAPRLGFGHFARASWRALDFFWQAIAMVVLAFLLLILLMILTLLVFGVGDFMERSVLRPYFLWLRSDTIFTTFLLLPFVAPPLIIATRYGLALPAMAAGDDDASFATAAKRSQGRRLAMAGAMILLGATAFGLGLLLERIFEALIPQMREIGERPAQGGYWQVAELSLVVAERLQSLRTQPLFWVYGVLNNALRLVAAVHCAAVLSVVYREVAAEEASVRSRAQV